MELGRTVGYRLVIAAMIGLSANGCRRSDGPIVGTDDVAAYGQLPSMSTSHDSQLQQEYARLVSELATPDQIDEHGLMGAASAIGAGPEDNVAAGLRRVFEDIDAKKLADQSAYWVTEPHFYRQDSEQSRLRSEFLEANRQYLVENRVVLLRPVCDFGLKLSDGLTANLDFVDRVRLATSLEAIDAAGAIAAEDLDGAIESLGYLFRLVGLLSREKHLVPRIAAVHIREAALRLTGMVARHPRSNDDIRLHLYELLVGQLTNWPRDEDAWIGDRAVGLHAFEMIRDGHLLSLLSSKEIKRYEDAKLFDSISENLDNDQRFYCETMRRIVAAAKRPYWERAQELDAVQASIQRQQRTAVGSHISIDVLLPDFETGQLLQATDRAMCEMWMVALGQVLRKEALRIKTNPLTGSLYSIDSLDAAAEQSRAAWTFALSQ